MVKFRRKGKKPPPPWPCPGDPPTDNAVEVAKKWKRSGLCARCGKVETHKVWALGTMRLPLTIKDRVYKGHCLGCKSITQAQIDLNEPVDGRGDIFNRVLVSHAPVSNTNSHHTCLPDTGSSGGQARHEQGQAGALGGGYPQARTPSFDGPHDESSGGEAATRESPTLQQPPTAGLLGDAVPQPPRSRRDVGNQATVAAHDVTTYHDPVPLFVAPRVFVAPKMGEPAEDDSVMSELTLDTSIETATGASARSLSSGAKNVEREKSLAKIEEEDLRKVSEGDDGTDQSQVGADPFKGGSTLYERKMECENSKSSKSSGSKNDATPGAQCVNDGDGYVPIYERKMSGEKGASSQTLLYDRKMSTGVANKKDQSQVGADAFKGESALYERKIECENSNSSKSSGSEYDATPGAQCVSDGDGYVPIYERKLSGEKGASSQTSLYDRNTATGVANKKDQSQVGAGSFKEGSTLYERKMECGNSKSSQSSGSKNDATPGALCVNDVDGYVPIYERKLSSSEKDASSQTLLYDRKMSTGVANKKAAPDADGSNNTRAILGAHCVNGGDPYVPLYERKMAGGKPKSPKSLYGRKMDCSGQNKSNSSGSVGGSLIPSGQVEKRNCSRPTYSENISNSSGDSVGEFSTASHQFANRFQSKTGKDTGSASSSTANEQSEKHLRSKTEEGNRSTSNPPGCFETASVSSSTASDQFEKRPRSNMEEDRSTSDSLDRSGTASVSSQTASDQFEKRLQAKNEEGNRSVSGSLDRSGLASVTSTASDQFEKRLRSKMEEGNKSTSGGVDRSASAGVSSSTASDQFEKRFHSKMEQGNRSASGGVDRSGLASVSSSTASDKFEKRLLSKMEEGNMSASGGVDRSARASVSSSTASDQFEKRLHSKMEQGSRSASDKRETIPESSALNLISNSSGYYILMDQVKKSCSEVVVLKALDKLLDRLTQEPSSQLSVSTDEGPGNSKTAFYNSGWAKNITNVMPYYSSNAIVQAQLLRTLWTIFALHPHISSDLISDCCMKQIIRTMETHVEDESVQEYGCGLLGCIAGTDQHALSLITLCNGKLLPRLMVALYFPGGKGAGNVQDNALRALFRLSSLSLSVAAEAHSRDSFANEMSLHVEADGLSCGDAAVNVSILGVMKLYPKNRSVQIHGNRLLWNIFTPDAILDLDQVDILVGNTLEHMEANLATHHNSQAVVETVACLLSKMSYFGIDNSHGSFLRIAKNVIRCAKSAIVARHGCRCVTNIYARSAASSHSVEEEGTTKIIISCMGTFKEHLAVQSEACAVLSAMCIFSPTNKERVHNLNGLERIMDAYELCTMNPYDEPFLTANIRICTALATLAVDPIIISDLRDKEIIMKLELLVEKSLHIPDKLRLVIQGLLSLASETEKESLVFRETLSEDDTCHWIRASLRVVTTSDLSPTRITYLRSNALWAMKKYPLSVSVHKNGCRLLACIFDLQSEEDSSMLHFYRELGIFDMEPDSDTESNDCSTMKKELGTVTDSLVEHRNTSQNAALACSALQNFCIMLFHSVSGTQGFDNLLVAAKDEVVKTIVMAIEKEDQTMEEATGALQALCAVGDGLTLSFETDSTIELLVEAMNKFTKSFELLRHGIGVVGVYFAESKNALEVLSDKLVTAIVRFIQEGVKREDAADSIDTVVNMILSITNMGFKGVTALLRNEMFIDSVISCMSKYPDSSPIQGNGSDILNYIGLDNFTRADVCKRGGLSRVISALDTHKQDPLLVHRAFATLGYLVCVADIQILAPAPLTMVRAMKIHPHNLAVQMGAANALWALSSRSVLLREEIVKLGAAEVIASAMAQFIGSKQMQSKGVIAIWSMSAPRSFKLRVGQCAIAPVINGLSAHISSQSISEEALGCLKCLAVLPANREFLEDNGAIDVIFSCLWLHSSSASVCKAALTALCHVTVNSEANAIVELTSDELDAVVFAMRAHQTVRLVQEYAIILLNNSTFCRTNLTMLEQNPFVVPLLRSAMSNFNTNFQDRADRLLRVLPEFQQ